MALKRIKVRVFLSFHLSLDVFDACVAHALLDLRVDKSLIVAVLARCVLLRN